MSLYSKSINSMIQMQRSVKIMRLKIEMRFKIIKGLE